MSLGMEGSILYRVQLIHRVVGRPSIEHAEVSNLYMLIEFGYDVQKPFNARLYPPGHGHYAKKMMI